MNPGCLAVIGLGSVGCMVLGWLFYDSWKAGVLLMPCSIWLTGVYKKRKYERDRRNMLNEFKELLRIVTANLKAGYSIENAWTAAEKDFQNMYPLGCRMQEELQRIIRKLSLNIPIEQAVLEFAEQSGHSDIISFAEVLCTAKRSGGNLVHMMEHASNLIAEKIEVEQEIQVLLSGKKMEQRMMCSMPIFMLFYLRIMNPGYLDSMYHNSIGTVIMTVCMLGTAAAAYWGSRIMRIEV